jgi:hypothetical protein
MVRGLVRWAEKVGETETWFARVELEGGETSDLAKTEYDAAGYSPAFWQLPKMPRSYSEDVSQGMKRVCKDFSGRVASFGFKQTKARLWTRVNEWSIESIYFHRSGSSYGGAPRNASVGIRVMLGIHVLNDPSGGIGVHSDHVRRKNGYAYHHRFNAETWSMYDRCVDELALFVAEFAEPWFAEWREPPKLMAHPELRQSTRKLLEEAIGGHSNPDSIAASLRALGIKKQNQKAQ